MGEKQQNPQELRHRITYLLLRYLQLHLFLHLSAERYIHLGKWLEFPGVNTFRQICISFSRFTGFASPKGWSFKTHHHILLVYRCNIIWAVTTSNNHRSLGPKRTSLIACKTSLYHYLSINQSRTSIFENRSKIHACCIAIPC